ncbi:beta-glucosidase [Auriculariales sp. MPI-PUGE-AT-0066]|nr:beta-glucosidase [Auriculariales sp. MPI-PUGE-AT-0066]
MSKDFANANLDELVDKLTVAEAGQLTTGVGFWRTASIPRFGIPQVKVSDGPNGIRGQNFFQSTKALCIPCATALGSTWDPELVHELGKHILAPETKARAASAILAPTINIQRSPLGGRSFESYSEDPHLSGTLAAAYVNGIQKEGVACTIKHFVCNDQENARYGTDSIVEPRALREIYLMPFMIAQRDSKPASYMTSYNRLNGVHCSENPWLLTTLLRGEWKSDAMVMSDWYGVYSVDLAIKAGLDLEMPGVRGLRQYNSIERALVSYKMTETDLRARARTVLEFAQRYAKENKDVIYGEDVERPATCSDAQRELLRRAAAQAIVLLKNDNNILPLDPSKVGKVAVIGPNAKQRIIYGGGSASLKPLYVVSPFEGLESAFGKDKTLYAEGIRSYNQLPVLDHDLITPDGQPGWRMEFFNHDAKDQDKPLFDKPVHILESVQETQIHLNDSTVANIQGLTPQWSIKLTGYLAPQDYDGEFEFGIGVIGRARLSVDGQTVVENWDNQTKGWAFFGRGSQESRGKCKVVKGQKHKIEMIYNNVSPLHDYVPAITPAVRLGGAKVVDADAEIVAAEKAAKEADVAILIIGLNHDWETEAFDRETLDLPMRTNELVTRVLKANPRTIIVNQSGSAVLMPWADQAPAILQSWYAGNSAGDAIADVVTGKVNPSGKLPLTFPRAIQDTPSYGNFGSKVGPVRYAEGLWVGYKHYVDRAIAPLWAFGHGLSYTTFEYSDAKLSTTNVTASDAKDVSLTVTVNIKNTGPRTGSEVVQVYTGIPAHPLIDRSPSRVLKGFARVKDIAAGKSASAKIVLDKYAFSNWDEQKDAWTIRKGVHTVRVASSSYDAGSLHEITFEKNIFWSGL